MDKGYTLPMEGEIELGNFEMISSSSRDDVWSVLLQQQEVMSKYNFDKTLSVSEQAWSIANKKSKKKSTSELQQQQQQQMNPPPISGIGEGFDEEDDSFVFKSDVKVSKLSDDALRSWCATFLLGMPDLGE